MDAVTTKPIDVADLFHKIDQVLGDDIHTSIAEKPSAPVRQTVSETDAEPKETSPEVADFLKYLKDVGETHDKRPS